MNISQKLSLSNLHISTNTDNLTIGNDTLTELLENNKGPQGPQGIPGTDGLDGNFGGLSFNNTFDSITTSADPGTGKLRLNNATQNTSTEIYLNNTDKYSNSIETMLQTLLNVANDVQKGFITLSKLYSPTDYLAFSVSDLTDNTGWWTLNVSIIAFSDTSPFTDTDDIIISYSIAGGGGFTNYINIRSDGISINKGDLLYVSGTHNENRVLVKKAQANSDATMPCIGISNNNLNANQDGLAVTYGKVKGLDTSLLDEGKTAYVSATTAGQVTKDKPLTNNDLIQNVGIVTRKNLNNGTIFVTGIGRSNDIPNGITSTSFNNINNYLYAYKDDNNRFDKLLIKDIGSIAKNYSSDPTTGIFGEIIYNNNINKLKVWNGSYWETITST